MTWTEIGSGYGKNISQSESEEGGDNELHDIGSMLLCVTCVSVC